MCDKKSVLVFDLDGTIFEEFLERDKVHIKRIFNNNKAVLFIDSIARFINSFDIIKNSMIFLRLRLAVYSLFVSKTYSHIMAEYEKWYKEEVLVSIISQIEELMYLSEYEIIILSNNLFSKGIEFSKDKIRCRISLITSSDKYKSLKKIQKERHIKFMIGNNFSDDILPSMILNISNIYLGKSRLVKIFAKYTFSNLKEIIKFILLKEEK